MEPIAHSENEAGRTQPLREHLLRVANLAGRFAEKFGAGELARCCGALHDLGKADPEVQAYLRRGDRTRGSGPPHAPAGAAVAHAMGLDLLSFIIAGHHSGLPDKGELLDAVRRWQVPAEVHSFRAQVEGLCSSGVELPAWLREPGRGDSRLRCEMLIRFLLSALCDADALDTERHFNPGRSQVREGEAVEPALLLERLRAAVERFPREGRLNRWRRRVYDEALANASQSPGFFSLTAPTGAGKTLATLGFALAHAAGHGLDRVIVVLPYTSIIEQSAKVYRESLRPHRCVLEHHHAVSPARPDEWEHLAAENWDAPVVVTTSVQFFESLHGRRPGRVRRLHNLARSVVVLDEVQTLPPGLLEPCLEMLRELVDCFGCSVLFCTATFPAFRDRLEGVREVVTDPEGLFRAFSGLRPVEYHLAAETERLDWSEVASRMMEVEAALAIVNTKADAHGLWQLVRREDPEAVYLTTNLCPVHRQAVLREVKRRLSAGGPCRVVATQLVEVGVDVDFPLVLRAMGPLDSIVQAAGRCNREGRLPLGHTVVFEPAEGGLPRGVYRTATEQARILLRQYPLTALREPGIWPEYFKRLYQATDTDVKNILTSRRNFQFQRVASCFRFIPERTVPVVVPYRGPQRPVQEVEALLEEVRRAGRRAGRDLIRRLQPYLVALSEYRHRQAVERGLCREVVSGSGLWEWIGEYDPELGISTWNTDPERMVL